MDRFRTIPQVRAAVKALPNPHPIGTPNYLRAPRPWKGDPQTYELTIGWELILQRASKAELLAWANKNL